MSFAQSLATFAFRFNSPPTFRSYLMPLMDIAVKFHSWIPFCNKIITLLKSVKRSYQVCFVPSWKEQPSIHPKKSTQPDDVTKGAVVNPQIWLFSTNMEAVLFSFTHLILNEINWIWTRKVGSRLKPTNIGLCLTLTLYCRLLCATSSIIWNGFTHEEYNVSCFLLVISKKDLLVEGLSENWAYISLKCYFVGALALY